VRVKVVLIPVQMSFFSSDHDFQVAGLELHSLAQVLMDRTHCQHSTDFEVYSGDQSRVDQAQLSQHLQPRFWGPFALRSELQLIADIFAPPLNFLFLPQLTIEALVVHIDHMALAPRYMLEKVDDRFGGPFRVLTSFLQPPVVASDLQFSGPSLLIPSAI